MRKWSHLANAPHIDWVIESLEQDPRAWQESRQEVNREAWKKAWHAARDIVKQDSDRLAAWDAAWNAVLYEALWDEAQWVAREAARSAIIALIIWDDLDHYLNLHYEQLKFVAVLSERHESVLLMPLAYVRERIHA